MNDIRRFSLGYDRRAAFLITFHYAEQWVQVSPKFVQKNPRTVLKLEPWTVDFCMICGNYTAVQVSLGSRRMSKSILTQYVWDLAISFQFSISLGVRSSRLVVTLG